MDLRILAGRKRFIGAEGKVGRCGERTWRKKQDENDERR